MSRGGFGDAGASWPARPVQERTDSASCRPATFVVGLLLILGLVAAPSVATADGRVALVIGNSAYAAIGELPNPGNDAADVGAALGRLGFAVTTVRDADQARFNEALQAFTRESVGADVALVFYAGHGLEMDGVNYLVPVDAQLERDSDVRFETVALDDVLAAVEEAALGVVILDACRNNPLARSMIRTSATRSVSRGFGELDDGLLGNETLVAYAAAAGTTAADGTGRNSPYTAALLAHLEEPLELLALFRQVRRQVLQATDLRQRPHEYQSLLSEHYLRGASGAAPAVTVAAVDGATSEARVQQETVFWQSIADSEESADFEAYLRQFPEGTYRALATNRATALRAAAVDLQVVAESASDPPLVAAESPSAVPVSVEPDPPASEASSAVVDLAPSFPKPGMVLRDCADCPELIVVPSGAFSMGSTQGQLDEQPLHEVRLSMFALGRYEVTRSEYQAFVMATGYTNDGCNVVRDDGSLKRDARASWRAPGFQQEDRHPVVCVSWEDGQAYTQWLSSETGEQYRLPSEAEWEYGLRASTVTRRYWAAGSGTQCDFANGGDRALVRHLRGWPLPVVNCTDGVAHTAQVGSYRPNAFGLHDMLGNVWEWTADCWHDGYSGAPGDGSAWTRGGDCDRRVLRGGAWETTRSGLRSANRYWYDNHGSNIWGFRIARDLR